jgi:hypothetical protein
MELPSIEEAAKSPYALVAYSIGAVIALFGGLRLKQIRAASNAAKKGISGAALGRLIEQATNSKLPTTITGEEWIRNNRNNSVAMLGLAAIICFTTVAVVVLVGSKKASPLEIGSNYPGSNGNLAPDPLRGFSGNPTGIHAILAPQLYNTKSPDGAAAVSIAPFAKIYNAKHQFVVIAVEAYTLDSQPIKEMRGIAYFRDGEGHLSVRADPMLADSDFFSNDGLSLQIPLLEFGWDRSVFGPAKHTVKLSAAIYINNTRIAMSDPIAYSFEW